MARKIKSLRLLVILFVSVSLLVFAVILFAIFRTAMPAMLLRSENEYLQKQIEVVRGAIEAAERATFTLADDVAIWVDTVHFAQGEDPNYIAKNWPDASLLHNYRCNFIVIKDLNGRILYEEFYDYTDEDALPIPAGFAGRLTHIERDLLARYQASPPPAGALGKDLGAGGVLLYRGVPYGVAVMPILPSHEARVPAGTVTMGNILNDEYFRQITHYSTTDFSLLESAPGTPAPGAPAPGADFAVDRRDKDNVSLFLPLQGANGDQFLLKMTDSRIIYQDGQRILDWATFALILGLILFGLVLYQIVLRHLLLPTERLSRDIENLESSDGLDTNAYEGTREFSALCGAINGMLRRLDQSNISLGVLQRILNGMDAYLYVSDPETDEILFINDRMVEHFVLDGEIVGRRCWDVLHPGQEERCVFCPLSRLEKNPGEVITWEEFHEGTGRQYRDTDCLIDWAGGKKAHLHLRVDITDLKNAEASLTKRLEQQELMSTIAQNFISSGDVPAMIQQALRAAGEFTGVDMAKISRLDPKKIWLEDEYVWRGANSSAPAQFAPRPFQPGEPMYDELITDKAPFIVHSDIQRDDRYNLMRSFGVKAFIVVPVHVSGSFWGLLSLTDFKGSREWSGSDVQLLRLIGGIISGVLTRSAMEEDLVRMSSIVNSSPQYVSYINKAGQFEYLNQGALNILGFSERELFEGGTDLFLDQETRRRVHEEIIPRVLNNGKAEFELPIVRKNGQRRILAFSTFRTGSKPVGIGSIASDITEKRLLEKELLAAKELAEQSSRAKGEFLSRMSHEMRTPLNAIIGMTHIARSSRDSEKKEYCLDKIDEASTHLLGVINDILDMSKIEANKFELSQTEFSFEKMLMRVANVINFRVDEKKQNLIINMAQNMPEAVIADEQRLAQVITNLLSNAVKFTPEQGTITLSASLWREEDGLCILLFSVTDTGIGISAEQKSRLFRSFEQADGGISRRFGGTGLGLAICKSIVELMGGEIWVNSEAGKGSTFSFTIKARRAVPPSNETARPFLGRENLRLLAVDDSPEVREYFLALARKLDLSCEVASDGLEAMRVIDRNKRQPFSIVFADWRMPGMNGIELTREIKKRFGENVVVIMISAAEWGDIETEAKAAGVDGFVPKPLFPSQIVNCINECLGLEPAEQEAAESQPRHANTLAGRRILLVEDIEINREIVLSLLQHTGISIDCAENGRQAVAMFENGPDQYDMIFMDIHMPEMDGYEATKRIRSLEMAEASAIPIVAMTANVFREDIEQCLAAGMNDHIGKPIDLEEIMVKLKRNLRGAAGPPQ